MRASVIGLLMLIAVVFVAAGCSNDAKKKSVAEACDRQVEQIQDEASESKIKEAKSSEDATKAERLVECAGQLSPAAVAAKEAADAKSGDDVVTPSAGAVLTATMLDDARGEFSKTCSSCHTLSDAKATGTFGPNLDELDLDADTIKHQIENGGGGMPPALLTGDDVEAMANYILQVQAK